MSEIIKPNQPTIQLQLSPDTAKALSSVLGEYALRITPPEMKEELTEDQKT